MIIKAELPGVESKNLDISLQDNVLTIKGERREKEEVSEDNYYCCEVNYGSFQRSITLPHGIKAEDIKANFENGMLEIVVPRAAEVTQAKRIPVHSSEAKRIEAEVK
jgi:HSP20 family protein